MHAFHVFSLLLVLSEPVGCQQDQVTDTQLDIVFLLDQERANLSMFGYDVDKDYCAFGHFALGKAFWCNRIFDVYETCSNYKMAYSGIKTWMTSFFDKLGASDTQFAVVVGCDVGHSAGVKHRFKDSNFKAMIPVVLDDAERGIKKGCRKNLDQMMQLATNEVFGPNLGHQPNSTVIAIVVSDCVQEPSIQFDKVKDEFNKFFLEPKRKVYFICDNFKHPCEHAYKGEIERFKNEMVELLGKNQQTSQSMIYLDPNNKNSQDVGQLLDQLLPKRSGVKDVNCNESWECGNCSGSGSCVQRCLWTHHSLPTGNGTSCTEKAPSNRSCTCPPTTAQPTEPPRIWPIALGVCSLLLLAVATLVAIFCCIRVKRSRKRAKHIAVAVREKQAPEKKAEVGVDLSMVQSMMGMGSKVKSMSRKGSMVKNVSKHGSSLVKMGSVSRPVGVSVKSISKPNREESKSLTGQNAKSIAGRSRKSMAPKSVASKSQVSKTKRPVAS